MKNISVSSREVMWPLIQIGLIFRVASIMQVNQFSRLPYNISSATIVEIKSRFHKSDSHKFMCH